MTEFITKGKFNNKFTTIPNSLIQNTDLTLEARGLLIFLLSKPSDWKVNVKNLSQDNDIGRDKCYKIINALIDSGYIVRNEEKIKGRYNYTEYFVYPEKQRKQGLSPCPENPDTEKPDTENKDYYKIKNIQNKEYIYTDEFNKFWESYPKRKNNQYWHKQDTFKKYKRLPNKKKIYECLINYLDTDVVKNGFPMNPNKWLKDDFYLQYENKIEIISEDRIREGRLRKYKMDMFLLDDEEINDLKKHNYINQDGTINEKKISKKK
tara:strand:- start:3994 stop:4785 length:792 start_codon:yes stop_codon:yes gene_type:complete